MKPTYFEGTEKKVELAVVDDFPSLRSFGQKRWRQVITAAGAHVVSLQVHPYVDAYLLSESSLFVFDTYLTMITCGQTRLVDGVQQILQFVPPEVVAALIYERKNEHFPQLQPTSFVEDARRLRQWVPGAAVRFGAEHEHEVVAFYTTRPYVPDPEDTTLEVLMYGIDQGRAAAFRTEAKPRAGTVAAHTGLDNILEGYSIDEHSFDPTGYSLNAIRDEYYYTVHVTPEPVGSYVSFETNADFRSDLSGLVARVIEKFEPESLDVFAFVPTTDTLTVELPGYRLRKHVQEPLSGYHVTFQHWYRPASGPRRAQPIVLD